MEKSRAVGAYLYAAAFENARAPLAQKVHRLFIGNERNGDAHVRAARRRAHQGAHGRAVGREVGRVEIERFLRASAQFVQNARARPRNASLGVVRKRDRGHGMGRMRRGAYVLGRRGGVFPAPCPKEHLSEIAYDAARQAQRAVFPMPEAKLFAHVLVGEIDAAHVCDMPVDDGEFSVIAPRGGSARGENAEGLCRDLRLFHLPHEAGGEGERAAERVE